MEPLGNFSMTTAEVNETSLIKELPLTTEAPHNRSSSFGGLSPKFGIPLVAFLVMLSITIVYLRYKIEKKAYAYMVPLYKQTSRRRQREEEYSEDGQELKDMEGLPSYVLVKPPPEYQVAVHMPKPESCSSRQCTERSDKYVLISDQSL